MLDLGLNLSTFALSGVVVGYLALVRSQRFANVKRLETQFAHLNGHEDRMTYTEASSIIKPMMERDMPYMTTLSLQFALFQTYAVPTISSLLARTDELSGSSTTARRSEDTSCILTEIMVHSPDSERGSLALARMNWLHARYGSKISRGDMLFTLCLFIYEPLRLTALFDWREPTALERQAYFVFWREVGARMGIKDIPETFEALAAWRDDYQNEHMKYAETNVTVANSTMTLFLAPYPIRLRPAIQQAMTVLVPEPVRIAFGWSRAQPSFLYTLVPAVLGFRAFLIKHFHLPRGTPKNYGLEDPKFASTNPKGEKVYHRQEWMFEPFYVKKSYTNWLWALVGLNTPGTAFRDDGYTIESLGPEQYRHMGNQDVVDAAAKIQGKVQGGSCPFAFANA